MDLQAKDVYDRSCLMFVYFLDWRHKLFAGYLASLAAMAAAYAKFTQYDNVLAGAVLVLSAIFWMIDFRIRDLFRHCSKAAKELESKSHIDGSFTDYEKGQEAFHAFSHSMAFDTLVLSVACFAVLYLALGHPAATPAVCVGLAFGIVPRILFEKGGLIR